MIIHPEDQNSLDWLVRKAGVPSASEMHNIFTPTFAYRTGEMVESYLHRKLCEWWLGGPLPGFNSIDLENGKIREEMALPYYELEFSETVTRVGFVTTDDGTLGCSPDALIGDEGGLECKCPAMHTHCKYLMNGEVPNDYIVQVHFSMFVTGRPWWKFLSFHPRLPALVKTVMRDEEIIAKIQTGCGTFLKRFEEAKQKLITINGEPPPRIIKESIYAT